MKTRYTNEEFIPIKQLLVESNEKTGEIKSIYGRETEYIELLMPIESFFAHYYYKDDPKLRDIDVIRTIKSIKMNYDKTPELFKTDIEKEMIGVISFAIRNARKKITRHELFLVLNYVLWCIDNRKYLGDSKAYLKWICNFFHLYNKEEKQKFDEEYQQFAKKFGWSKEKIALLKNEDTDFEPAISDAVSSKIDSERFAKDQDL